MSDLIFILADVVRIAYVCAMDTLKLCLVAALTLATCLACAKLWRQL